MDDFRNALILSGPTGSGKTAVALLLAEQLDAEIVSMDSMAVYRGMDIGTAKPTPTERDRVRHHLVDVLDPWESASVAWWLEQAAKCCKDIEGRGKRVLLVGGTPLYLKALLLGLFEGPSSDPELRQRLSQEAELHGEQALHDRLARVDPATAQRLHPNDVRRVIRALEVLELTGQPISIWQQQWPAGKDTVAGRPRAFWLDLPRAELYARINERVTRMIAAGLVEEVRGLKQQARPLSQEARQAIGYKEVLAHLDGERGLAETIQLIQTRSRNLAKRQVTWFRHMPACAAVTPETVHEKVMAGL